MMWRYFWWSRSKHSCLFVPGGRWTRQYVLPLMGGILYLCGIPH